jgi:hypothetical protein
VRSHGEERKGGQFRFRRVVEVEVERAGGVDQADRIEGSQSKQKKKREGMQDAADSSVSCVKGMP